MVCFTQGDMNRYKDSINNMGFTNLTVEDYYIFQIGFEQTDGTYNSEEELDIEVECYSEDLIRAKNSRHELANNISNAVILLVENEKHQLCLEQCNIF